MMRAIHFHSEAAWAKEMKDWRWEKWRFEESLEALRVVARRYRAHPAVSGIAVCNEPSETLVVKLGDTRNDVYDMLYTILYTIRYIIEYNDKMYIICYALYYMDTSYAI